MTGDDIASAVVLGKPLDNPRDPVNDAMKTLTTGWRVAGRGGPKLVGAYGLLLGTNVVPRAALPVAKILFTEVFLDDTAGDA